MTEYRFEAIGTKWNVTFTHPAPDALMEHVYARIEEFDKNYSRFRNDSLVSNMATQAGEYTMPSDAQPLLSLYIDLYRITLGGLTPLIGQTLSDAGYDAQYSLIPKKLTRPPALESIFSYTHPTVVLKEPALLDFGAAGKGYLVDIVCELLLNAGALDITIDAGGDIRVSGDTPSRVALEDPNDASKAIGIATISNQSICGSAGNRRSWGEYTHILDPHTLTSPSHIAALWVVAENTMLADALTTALYFVPASTLLRTYRFSYLILYQNGSVEYSADFPAELFSR